MSLADAVPFAVAHWSLDEASGTRTDSIGSSHLTDNNTVGSTTGKLGNAATFSVANSEYLNIADNAALSMGDIDFTILCWVYFDSLANNRTLLSKADSATNQREYWLEATVGGSVTFSVDPDGTGAGLTTVSSGGGTVTTGQWYFVVAWHDAANNQIGISLNAGTPQTAAHSAGVFDGTANFNLGARNNSPALFMDGRLDDVVIFKNYILSDAQRTAAYDSGAGIAFADWFMEGLLTGTAGVVTVTSSVTQPSSIGTGSVTVSPGITSVTVGIIQPTTSLEGTVTVTPNVATVAIQAFSVSPQGTGTVTVTPNIVSVIVTSVDISGQAIGLVHGPYYVDANMTYQAGSVQTQVFASLSEEA